MTGFTGAPVDRAEPIRQSPERLAEALADPAARLLRMDGLDPVTGPDGALQWAPLDPSGATADLALLGLIDGAPRFVALTPTPGGPARSAALMALLDRWPAPVAATWAIARNLIDWHARHRFCAQCGAATRVNKAGWSRACPACGTEHFPRTDPVVIMLAEHDGRALVGRQARWPTRRFSALAGFVEPGESIEEAVARELFEEAGVRVADVRYMASQPWPFPSQLMIACIARATDDALAIDRTELEDAMWVSRATLADALAGVPDAEFLPPPPYAIARTLMARWLGDAGASARDTGSA